MLKVLLAGTFQTQTGYGKHFRNLCKVLKESFDISIYSALVSVLPKAILKEEEINLLNNRKVLNSKFDVAIFNTIPPLFPVLRQQIKADCYLGYTVIEGRGRVLPDWAEASKELDLLIVPSLYSSKPFEATGLRPRIVPLGVDLEIFRADPRRKERPFRLPALEAMACGLPCIITEVGGHREFVNEENSYLVKVESEELPRNEHFYKYLLWHQCDWRILANLMLEAFRDRKKLKGKSVLARETASQFSWERMGDSLRLLIEEVYYGKTRGHRGSSEKAAHSAYR